MENIPSISIPNVETIQTISIPLPTGKVPFYKPLVVPPSDLREPEGTQPEAKETDTGLREVKIPVIDYKVPIPENEILITAGTTAVVSVAATLTATAAFKWAVTAMKPLLKQAIGKISGRKKEGVNTRV